MKIIKSLLAFAAFFALNSVSAETFTERWPQIKAYHELMTKTYHPAESGDLEPIRTHSELLVQKAEALTVENMPKEFRNPKTIETLLVLKKQTKVVNDLVLEQAADHEITKALSALHDTFHKIVTMCQTKK